MHDKCIIAAAEVFREIGREKKLRMIKLGMYVLIFVIVIYKCVLHSHLPSDCPAAIVKVHCSSMPAAQSTMLLGMGMSSVHSLYAGWWRRQYIHF